MSYVPNTTEAVYPPAEYYRICNATILAERFGMIDGEHHKQWLIDQMLREMLGSKYQEWRESYDHESTEEGYELWNEGVTP